MADRLRVVTLDSAGAVSATLEDFEDGLNVQKVRDSFQLTPAPRRQIKAEAQRRYAGSRVVGELHDNAAIGWTALIDGASADTAIANLEGALSVLETSRTDLFIEWRPEGATNSVFYEVRGPATWKTNYRWATFAGARLLICEIAVPVSPLARRAPATITHSALTLPTTVALSSLIGGDADALADVQLTPSGGTSAPVWALLGWTKRPGTPLSGSVAPWGIVEAETSTLTTFASTADANARGGNLAQATASGAGSGTVDVVVDPSVMQADPFTLDELQLEVWARVKLTSTLVNPTAVLSVVPDAGTNFGAQRYSNEFGSTGKLLTKPSSGTVYRFVRLGTVPMAVRPQDPVKWRVRAALSWAASSSGAVGIDYLLMVPAKRRALGVTGRPLDSAFPRFVQSTTATRKRIRSDLSALVAQSTGAFFPDVGLGGEQLELPVGTVDMVLKLSSLVPDDPTSDTTTEQLAHTADLSVFPTPRYWVAS